MSSCNTEERMSILNFQKFRGYSPLGSEKSTGTDDDPIAAEDAVSVLSEAFDIGYETAIDVQKSKGDPLPHDPYGLYGDNQWPNDDSLPNFSRAYIEYCSLALELCRKMMRIFALALGLSEDHFDSMVQNPGVTSRMMHYPPQPVKEEVREGLGAHTVSFRQGSICKDRLFELLFRTTNASPSCPRVACQGCRC
jgi:isopenicillin N synthase-like dioxygenase